MPRFDHLAVIGRVRCYDSGPKTIDRYTVVFEDMPDPTLDRDAPVTPYGPRQALAMSDSPTHPQGFSQWTEARPGPWLGRRIPFADLPQRVRDHVLVRSGE